MTKYTKAQYRADLAANEIARAENVAKLEKFMADHEAGVPLSAEIIDAWNMENDRTYEIEQQRKDIERRFSTRNWNWQDHSFSELVSQNVD